MLRTPARVKIRGMRVAGKHYDEVKLTSLVRSTIQGIVKDLLLVLLVNARPLNRDYLVRRTFNASSALFLSPRIMALNHFGVSTTMICRTIRKYRYRHCVTCT